MARKTAFLLTVSPFRYGLGGHRRAGGTLYSRNDGPRPRWGCVYGRLHGTFFFYFCGTCLWRLGEATPSPPSAKKTCSVRHQLRISHFWPDWNCDDTWGNVCVSYTIFGTKEAMFLFSPNTRGLKIRHYQILEVLSRTVCIVYMHSGKFWARQNSARQVAKWETLQWTFGRLIEHGRRHNPTQHLNWTTGVLMTLRLETLLRRKITWI